MKRLYTGALLCLAASLACLAESTGEEQADSTTHIKLKEISIRASRMARKSDGITYFPSSSQKESALSGTDLLQKLQLPGISVNPMTGSIRQAGGILKLFVNGVEVEASEIAALRPKDIVRIDHHTTPGAKYADADAAIDIITRRSDEGGYIVFNGMEALGSGKWASLNNISARYNRGESSFALTTGIAGLHRDNWIRDYEEKWIYPDRTVTRNERGLPVSIGNRWIETTLSYTLRKHNGLFLDVRGGFNLNHIPSKEEGDRHTILQSSDKDALYEILEHTEEKETSPSLGAYLKLPLGEGEYVCARVSGHYLQSKSLHSYCESLPGGQMLTNLSTEARGRKYTVPAEAYYDLRRGESHFSAGVRHKQIRARNRYRDQECSEVIINQSESSLFADYDLQLRYWNLTASLEASRLYSSQNGYRTTRYSLSPSLGATYSPNGKFTASIHSSLRQAQAPLSSLNDVEQEIQPGIIRRGNPDVRPFMVWESRLAGHYTHRMVDAGVSINFKSEHKPVMSTNYFDGRQFVNTFENQGSYRELRCELNVVLRPWGEHLTIGLAPSLTRYFSRGKKYSHTKTLFHPGVNLNFSYGHWLASACTMTGGANGMYGEEFIHEKEMNMILVGYRKANWTVEAGAFNAFMGEYDMTTENLSALTPYVSRAHCSKNTYAVVRLNLNLNFGKQKAQDEDTDYLLPDSDTGLMNNLK